MDTLGVWFIVVWCSEYLYGIHDSEMLCVSVRSRSYVAWQRSLLTNDDGVIMLYAI
jgi:hypothetical protein